VAFLNESNTAIESLRVFRQLQFARITIRNPSKHEWLLPGKLLRNIGQFVEVMKMVRAKSTLV
jgi:hypothetical protein